MNALMLAQETIQGLPKVEHDFYGMGTVVLLAISALILLGVAQAILLLVQVVAPGLSQRCAGAVKGRSFVSFLAGIPVMGIFLVLGAIGKKVEPVGLVTVLFFGFSSLLALAVTAEDIGRRLYWANGKEGSRIRHLMVGWPIFCLSSAVPVLGWWVILPYGMISGLGSIVLAIFGKGRQAAPTRS